MQDGVKGPFFLGRLGPCGGSWAKPLSCCGAIAAQLDGGRGIGDDRAMTVPIIERISTLAHPVEAWLCDIWGVLHNGAAAFPGAVDALQRFQAAGGIALLVSNAPRPAAAVEAQLTRLGIPRDAYADILTSGDVTRERLAALGAASVLHIGPERDRGLFEGCDIGFADAAGAQWIVCSGLHDDTRETPEDYRARLQPLAERGVPMLCANPDLTVDRGGQIVWCAGGVARLYAELGGKVDYAGKPHAAIYATALARIAALGGRAVAKDRILAVGDGLATDIAGARAAGIASVYVASAVNLDGPISTAGIAALFAAIDPKPVAAMAALAW